MLGKNFYHCLEKKNPFLDTQTKPEKECQWNKLCQSKLSIVLRQFITKSRMNEASNTQMLKQSEKDRQKLPSAIDEAG